MHHNLSALQIPVRDAIVHDNSSYAVSLSALRPQTHDDGQVKTDFYRRVYCLLGLPVDAVSMEQAIGVIRRGAERKRRIFFSTPNLNFLIGSLTDAHFRDSVIRSDLSVADGMPLVWIARSFGLPIRERVAGSSLFEEMRERDMPMSVYFFGGPNGAAREAEETINAGPASMRCVGSQSPGFGSIEDLSRSDVIEQINRSRADFLIVALGAKKGQAWIEHNLKAITVPVISHLGAVVNIVAGRIDRAPAWVQRIGLEWMWRIKEEPALWKRYAHDAAALTKLLVGRVIPCAAYTLLYSGQQDAMRSASASFERQARASVIRMSGAWSEENSYRLRDTLALATRAPGDIRFDMREVSWMDNACIALLALLYGHQLKIGHAMSLTGLRPRVARLFRLHCADYLLASKASTALSLRRAPSLAAQA